MTNTAIHQELGQRIEQLVQEHIAAIHQAAREALGRAFTSAPRSPSRVVRERAAASAGRKRRAPAEVSALSERLYRVVCGHPGEGITVLARELGASARELHRPMMLLRRAGRVRSVGQRHNTRYFPRANAGC
jgi:hypothetical protein